MSKKTRYFVLTAAAILAIGLTTGLVASFMGFRSPSTRAAGPDELQYVPADAAVVAYANVEIMNSKFRERFRKFEPDTSDRDEFQQKTGVNIEEDIHSVVAAMIPGAEGQTTSQPERHADPGARPLRTVANSKPSPSSTAAASRTPRQALAHTRQRQGEADLAMGFLDADLIALGGYLAIKKSIDAGGSGTTSSPTAN